MSSVIVSPIASPAIDLKAPPGSTAVAKTTQTRKNVRISSITSPCQWSMPPPRPGAPRFVNCRVRASKNQRSSAAAAVAPASCMLQ